MAINKEQARQQIQALIDEYRRLRKGERPYFERMSETDLVNKFVTPYRPPVLIEAKDS